MSRNRWVSTGKLTPLPAIALLASLLLAVFLFNQSVFRPILRRSPLTERLAELEAEGLLLQQPIQAVRAFAVQEFEDEGLHYYVELADGRVLYLNGQYLYDYAPIADDPDVNQLRSFPSIEFQILRHKAAGYVLDIRCAGTVLEPELTAAPFTREDHLRGVPEDGEIIADRSYENLKRESTERSPRYPA